ncbi:MAG: hypothetical protein ACOCSJ_03720 [Candidatus Natronoplasma sp.]
MPGPTPHSESIFDSEIRHEYEKEEGYRLYYLFMSLIVLGATVGIILIGGMFRLTLALFILFVIGFNLVYWMMEKTVYLEIWERKDEFDEEVNLNLRETSDLVERAFKGMELSQGYLEKKIRDLFMDKLMDNKNLSIRETRELLEEPDRFRQVVDDKIISDFILSKKEENEQSSTESLEGEDYEQWISTLLKRIEGWE